MSLGNAIIIVVLSAIDVGVCSTGACRNSMGIGSLNIS